MNVVHCILTDSVKNFNKPVATAHLVLLLHILPLRSLHCIFVQCTFCANILRLQYVQRKTEVSVLRFLFQMRADLSVSLENGLVRIHHLVKKAYI